MFAKYRIIQIIGLLTLFFQFGCSMENPIPTPTTYIPKPSDVFYKGTYMAYVAHQETYGGVVFKER